MAAWAAAGIGWAFVGSLRVWVDGCCAFSFFRVTYSLLRSCVYVYLLASFSYKAYTGFIEMEGLLS
jgi:hypothetical protein